MVQAGCAESDTAIRVTEYQREPTKPEFGDFVDEFSQSRPKRVIATQFFVSRGPVVIINLTAPERLVINRHTTHGQPTAGFHLAKQIALEQTNDIGEPQRATTRG